MSQDIVNIQVGKQGITTALLSEIRKQNSLNFDRKKSGLFFTKHLKAKKSIKVRFLKSALNNKDRKQLASELKEKLKVKGTLIGNVFSIKNG